MNLFLLSKITGYRRLSRLSSETFDKEKHIEFHYFPKVDMTIQQIIKDKQSVESHDQLRHEET